MLRANYYRIIANADQDIVIEQSPKGKIVAVYVLGHGFKIRSMQVYKLGTRRYTG